MLYRKEPSATERRRRRRKRTLAGNLDALPGVAIHVDVNAGNVLVAIHDVLGGQDGPRERGITKKRRGIKYHPREDAPLLDGVDGVLLGEGIHGVLLRLSRQDGAVVRIGKGLVEGTYMKQEDSLSDNGIKRDPWQGHERYSARQSIKKD